MPNGFGLIPADVHKSSATESGVAAEMAATTAAGAAALTGVTPMALDADSTAFAAALNADRDFLFGDNGGPRPAADRFRGCAVVGVDHLRSHGRDPRHRAGLIDKHARRSTLDRATGEHRGDLRGRFTGRGGRQQHGLDDRNFPSRDGGGHFQRQHRGNSGLLVGSGIYCIGCGR